MTTDAVTSAIRVIFPYRQNGVWMFDDATVGLVQEPFIAGVPMMVDVLVVDVPGAEDGFKLIFSDRQFPHFEMRLDWVRSESGGNWYRLASTHIEGRLCPAMFKYFSEAPKKIYCRAEALTKPPQGENHV